MKSLTLAAAAAFSLLLTGCVANAAVDYAPTSSMTAKGAVIVDSFRYLPALDGKVKPNQLKNTALGPIMIDHNVDAYFRDAVFKELRTVGINVADSKRHLGGEIKEFLVDDLGFNVDWTVDVHYVVTNASGATVYDSEKRVTNRTVKFVNAFQVLNTQIKDNIEELLRDPAFIAAINPPPAS